MTPNILDTPTAGASEEGSVLGDIGRSEKVGSTTTVGYH